MNDLSIERLFTDYVAKGDIGALGEVFDRVAPDLERLAKRLTRDRNLARDLVQETFLTALEHPETFQQGRQLRPWLLGILVHRARKEQRLASRLEPEPTRVDSSSPDRALEAREFREAVEGAVAELPGSLRAALKGSLLEGKGTRELAQELAISGGTLRVRLHRGLERLRLALPSGLATGFALLFIHSRGIAQVRSHVLQQASRSVGHPAPAMGAITKGIIALMTSKVILATLATLSFVLIAALGHRWFNSESAVAPTIEEHPGLTLTAPSPENALPNNLLATASQAVQRSEVSPAVDPVDPDAAPVRAAGWGQLKLAVTDAASDSPVVGLLFDIRNGDGSEGENLLKEFHVVTSAQGTASATLATGLPLLLELRSCGVNAPLLQLDLEPLFEGEIRHLEVQVDGALQEKYWVRVVADENGMPLPGASIVEVDPFGKSGLNSGTVDELRWRSRPPMAKVDEFGLIAMPRGFALQRRFAVLAEGRAPGFFDEERTATTVENAYEVRISLPARVNVLVLGKDGQPIESMRVRLDAGFGELMRNTGGDLAMSLGRHAVFRTTDESGRVTFEALPTGVVFATALLSPGIDKKWQVTSVEVPALVAGQQFSLTLEAKTPTDVFGVAIDQNGGFATGAQLILLRDNQGWRDYLSFNSTSAAEQSATVGQNGEFRFEAVPAGRWLVAPKALRDSNHALTGTVEPSLENLFAPVPTRFVLEGDESAHDLMIDVWRDLYIRGTVEDDQSNPIQGATVFAAFENNAGFQFQHTAADGSFTLGPFPDRTLYISARSFEVDSATNEVISRPGETDILLRLAPNGKIKLVSRDSMTGADVVCEFLFWKSNTTGSTEQKRIYSPSSATCTLDRFSSGTWNTLATASPNLVAIRTGIEVQPGQTTEEILMSLQPGGKLLLARPASEANDYRRFEVRLMGTRLNSQVVRPGESIELTLPLGRAEVVEYTADGAALPGVVFDISLEHAAQFLASE